MRKLLVVGVLVVPLVVAAMDTRDDLIALDREWGVANLKADKAVLDRLYASDLIAVTPTGVLTKAEMLAGLEPAENTDYVTSDYEVAMLGENIAVMAHKGDGYRSLHVFEMRNNAWQVVATATIPDAPEGAND